ncbi:hypothetical protein ACIO3R_21315 [Streptomyces sp. NPDC087428]|uniref:hypothetical protein n=1 Tax=Streptomyces sp. NPDC087428 TaxID=3365788 RepID=UPI00380A3719
MSAVREVLMRKSGRTRRRTLLGSALEAVSASARAAPAAPLVAALLFAALPSPSYAVTPSTGPNQLYR